MPRTSLRRLFFDTLCIVLVPFYLHIIQAQFLVLLPCPVVHHNLHIRVRVGCVKVLYMRVRQWIIQNERERMIATFYLNPQICLTNTSEDFVLMLTSFSFERKLSNSSLSSRPVVLESPVVNTFSDSSS